MTHGTFLERLRGPRLGGWSSESSMPNPYSAGFNDPLNRAANNANPNAWVDSGNNDYDGPQMSGNRRGNVQPMGGIGTQNVRRPRSQMDTVYDQGPEQFAQQMKLRNRELDIRSEQVQAMIGGLGTWAGLRQGELGVRQQNANTNQSRVEAIMARQDLTDSQKAAMIFENSMALEGTRQDGRINLERNRGDNAMERTNAAIAGQQGVQAMRGEQDMSEITARGNQDRQTNAAQPVAPAGMAAELNDRVKRLIAQNPQYADVIELDDKGNYIGMKKPVPASGGYFGTDFGASAGTEDLRKKATQALFGPQDVQISEQPGGRSPAPLAPKVNAGVDMIDPSGRPLRVPVNEVAAMEKLGAKRKPTPGAGGKK